MTMQVKTIRWINRTEKKLKGKDWSREVSAREMAVLYYRIIEKKTLEEIGKEMNVNRRRVHQLQKTAIEKLRKANIL